MALSNTSVAGGPTNVINSEQSALTFFGPASTSQTSQEFTVDQFPFYLSAYNLGSDDVITVQQVVSHGGTKLASTYQPVYGPLALDTNRSKLVIEHPGRYQLVHSGSSSLGTFTVLGAAASSASTGFAELAAGLQAVVKGVSVTGASPVAVTGAGTQANPYVVGTPDIVVEANSTPGKNILIGPSIVNPGTNINVVIGWDIVATFTGDAIVAIGKQAATSVNVAQAVCVGALAGAQNNNGTNLTAIGYHAGNLGRRGTYFGAFAGAGGTFDGAIVINNSSGTALNTTQANQVVIGDSSITQMVTAGSIIQGGVISASDVRLKTNIQGEQLALEKINQLQPVTFKWNHTAVDEFNAVVDTTEMDDIQHGLLAQELEKVFPTFVKSIDRGHGAYKVVRYEKLIPILIAAIQDLTDKVNELEGKVNG